MTKVKPKLKELTGKELIRLTPRCNDSIDRCLNLAKRMGKTKVIIQDQGGWIHYKKAPPKLSLEIIYVKTNNGVTDLNHLKDIVDEDSIFLCNSMPGYIVYEDINSIYGICKSKDCLLINDVSGSIGTDIAKVGDIIIGSFGRFKPVNLEYGGFCATDKTEFAANLKKSVFDVKRKKELLEKLENLSKKIQKFYEIRDNVISDLKKYDVIFKDRKGINVIVLFKDCEEKKEIIDYCDSNDLEYTFCPRYIRVEKDAVSIEIKRL